MNTPSGFLILLLGAAVAALGNQGSAPSSPAGGAPFEAHFQRAHTWIPHDGSVSDEVEFGIIRRDSLGRARLESGDTPRGPFTNARIHDPVAGLSWELDLARRRVISKNTLAAVLEIREITVNGRKYPMLPWTAEGRAEEKIGQALVESLACDGFRVKSSGYEREYWFSAELRWVVWDHVKGAEAESTYRLYDIRRAEPEKEIFTVPLDYTTLPRPKQR